MEALFNADFSEVLIHVGPEASAIGARAFTLGADLFFAPGQYSPATARGWQLLGHELAHVLQQRSGRVRNPLGHGVAVFQDPALEAEADEMGRQAAALQPRFAHALVAESDATFRVMAPARLVAEGVVQMLPDDEEVISQATFLKYRAQELFKKNKELCGDLMEVQGAFIDQDLYMAANYRVGNGGDTLESSLGEAYEYYHGKQRQKTYRKSDFKLITGELHAEQALLQEVAKRLEERQGAEEGGDHRHQASLLVLPPGSSRV